MPMGHGYLLRVPHTCPMRWAMAVGPERGPPVLVPSIRLQAVETSDLCAAAPDHGLIVQRHRSGYRSSAEQHPQSSCFSHIIRLPKEDNYGEQRISGSVAAYTTGGVVCGLYSSGCSKRLTASSLRSPSLPAQALGPRNRPTIAGPFFWHHCGLDG